MTREAAEGARTPRRFPAGPKDQAVRTLNQVRIRLWESGTSTLLGPPALRVVRRVPNDLAGDRRAVDSGGDAGAGRGQMLLDLGQAERRPTKVR